MNSNSNGPPSNPRPGDRSAFDWARDSGLNSEIAREVRAEVRRRRRRRLALGAGAALALGLAGALWQQRPVVSASAASGTPGAGTVVSVPASRTLPDGSIVELKSGAQISVDFASDARRVVLRHGVAHFQVTKDAARPFIVSANGVDVRAVGTAFSVELGEQAVAVVVTEGTVALRQKIADTSGGGSAGLAAPPPPTDQRVVAGQHAVVPLSSAMTPTVHPLTPADLAQRMAWRMPRLEFSGTPLSEVVALVRRHGGVRLALGDPSLARVQVSGILRADNTAALLQLLAADHGIVGELRGEETVLVRSRGP